MTGKKFDQDKVRMELVRPRFIRGIAQVLTMGAKKYGAGNWETVENAHSRYTGALLRHINKYQEGEKFDQESGLHHLLHAACNLMFLMENQQNEDTNLQRHRSRNSKSDPKSIQLDTSGREINSDEGDRRVQEHIQELVGILDNGGSSECIRACVDDFRLERGIEIPPRTNNPS